MKARIFGIAALCAMAAQAIPQSPVITYGQIRDEYGTPLESSSAMTLKLVKADDPDGWVYASAVVGKTAYPGMNYRLSLEIDSDGPTRPYAVLKGTQMRIRFFMDGNEQTAAPEPVFATPANGTAQRLDFSIGEDADGDGMPDAWESWVLQMVGEAYAPAAVAAFKPGDDADGDGMSNYREFLAGTDPFLSTDLFEITHYEKTGEGERMEISFTTAPDRTYRIVTSASLGDSATWVPVKTARERDATAAYETYAGTGYTMTLYIDTTIADAAFFRVVSQ